MTKRTRRRLTHVGVVVAVFLVALAALSVLIDARTRVIISLATAYASLALLLATLAVSPLRRLRGLPVPTSLDLRRDLGLGATALGVVHVGIAAGNHFKGNLVRYVWDRGSLRVDEFGAGVWLGVAATAILLALAATSSDRALRRLRGRWTTVQRFNLVLGPLAVLHTVAFWIAIDRPAALVGSTILGTAAVTGLRVIGRAKTTEAR